MAQCPRCHGAIAMMAVTCAHCGYDFPLPSTSNEPKEEIGPWFIAYIVTTWLSGLIIFALVFGSPSGPASTPSNLWAVVFLAWGYAGLGCVNFLASIVSLFFDQTRHALHLFISSLPVMVILLIVLVAKQV